MKKSYKMSALDALPLFLLVVHITKYMLISIVVNEKIQSLTYAPPSPQAMLIIASDTGVAHMAME